MSEPSNDTARGPIAVLGPGGVGGLIAALLDRAGEDVVLIAREETAALIAAQGLQVSSVTFGKFEAYPPVVSTLTQSADALIVATKAGGLPVALERITAPVGLVLPLLNGLDHLARLRKRFGSGAVAGTIRVEADRPEPGFIVHSSKFLRIEMASADPAQGPALAALAARLEAAGISTYVGHSEAQVLWAKLVRLNALACTTSASGLLIGEIRSDPRWRARLKGAIDEASAVAAAEGAEVDPDVVLAELDAAHATLGSSMARDIAAGRAPELDAIPGAVLRAAARHHLDCPVISELFGEISLLN